MIKISKERVVEVLNLNPVFLIGKEIMLKDWGSSCKILDVNLKCTHIKIAEPSGMTIRWINLDELEDEILFDEFGVAHNKMITIKTLNDMIENCKII